MELEANQFMWVSGSVIGANGGGVATPSSSSGMDVQIKVGDMIIQRAVDLVTRGGTIQNGVYGG
jgi:hypothetical protein